MEHAPDNDNGIAWSLSAADEDGSVWIDWRGDGPAERLNLGRFDQVAEALTCWLEQQDYGERA